MRKSLPLIPVAIYALTAVSSPAHAGDNTALKIGVGIGLAVIGELAKQADKRGASRSHRQQPKAKVAAVAAAPALVLPEVGPVPVSRAEAAAIGDNGSAEDLQNLGGGIVDSAGLVEPQAVTEVAGDAANAERLADIFPDMSADDAEGIDPAPVAAIEPAEATPEVTAWADETAAPDPVEPASVAPQIAEPKTAPEPKAAGRLNIDL